jgi:hypothetical protein
LTEKAKFSVRANLQVTLEPKPDATLVNGMVSGFADTQPRLRLLLHPLYTHLFKQT